FFVINHSFIKTINSDSNSTKHEPGTKIIEAFYNGFETINHECDFIVKLYADVILPNDYFETLAEEFQRNTKAGIV
ncbi:MAG: glycosyltransferase family 2 protein, partial [Moheibacter sp.]